MLTIHKFIIVFAAITTAITGAKNIRWHLNPVFIFIEIMNIIGDILTQIFIAYKFPLLFVSWRIISDPLFQDIIKKYINILKKNKVKS